MRITVDGVLGEGVGAKDIVLAIIGEIAQPRHWPCDRICGRGDPRFVGGRRMTVCNMTIEAGARAG